MGKLICVEVLPHQTQNISLKSVLPDVRPEWGMICKLSCMFKSLPHHPGNGLSSDFICVIVKDVTDQLCSQTREYWGGFYVRWTWMVN